MASSSGTGVAAVAGWLLAAMLVLVPAAELELVSIWPGAVAGWMAALLLWPRIPRRQKRQAVVLAVLGLAGLVFAAWQGAPAQAHKVASQNHLILCMLAGVTFLRLVSMPAIASGETERLPRGRGALMRTLAGVHAFGAVINLSAVVVIGDRLTRAEPMTTRMALLLSRGFTCAVFYSPFFGGTALALTLAEGARLSVVVACGLPLALAGLGFAAWDATRGPTEELDNARGYPTDFRSLRVPAMLAVGILVTHALWPAVSVLTLIAWTAPLLVWVILAAGSAGGVERRLHAACATTGQHVSTRLPEMSGELILFLAAGLLASGLTALFGALGGWLPVTHLDGTTATAILALTVLAGMAGLHPVIALSTAASVLAPTGPRPDLLAVMFVMSWGIGTAVSPMAVTHLTMQGRYGIDAWQFPRRNLGYGATMLVLAALVLHLLDAALG